ARGRAAAPVVVTAAQPSGTLPTAPQDSPVAPERPRSAVAAPGILATPDHHPGGLSTQHAERPRPGAASGTTPEAHRVAAERTERPGAGRFGGTLGGSSPEPLPAEARALLERAEEALRLNQPQEAIRLVDQSFFIQKSSRGYAIQTRAACARHDLGAARAAFRNVTHPDQRRHVRAACARRDIPLQ